MSDSSNADDESPAFKRGTELRSRVLGAAHVSKAGHRPGEFGSGLGRLTNEVAWGTIWTRDGLTLRDRSLVTVAALCALGRSGELAVHVRGALNNGVLPTELEETFIQVGLYAGFPAAGEGVRVTREVLQDRASE